MTHFYSTTWSKKQPFFSKNELSRDKVMSTYLTHYRNRCLLDRLLIAVIDDHAQKYQVGLEIAICDRKLAYWSNHALFSLNSKDMQKIAQIKTACLTVNF
jgi:hypothetical protein